MIISQTCHSGQMLENERHECKVILEDVLRDRDDEVQGKMKRDFDLLLSRLSQSNPISPYSFFGVNHSSLLQALATAFTYLIVLMQFKVSEK